MQTKSVAKTEVPPRPQQQTQVRWIQKSRNGAIMVPIVGHKQINMHA